MSVTISPISTHPVHEAVIPDVPIHRLTVEQYEAMIGTGILTEDDPVELLEGWLVEKMTKNPPHMVANALILRVFPRLLPPGWFLAMQDPIATMDSLPEPDATVIRGEPRDYLQTRPDTANIGLVVEVADTSLDQDRGAKKRIYARASIPVYWIVNLVERQIEVYTESTGPTAEPTYGQRQDYGPADTISLVLDGVAGGSLAVSELLP